MADPNDLNQPARFGARKRGPYRGLKRVHTAVETLPAVSTAAQQRVAMLQMIAQFEMPYQEWVFVKDAGITGYTVQIGRWVELAIGGPTKGVAIANFVVEHTITATDDMIVVQKGYGEVGVYVTAASGIDASNGVHIAYRGINHASALGRIS